MRGFPWLGMSEHARQLEVLHVSYYSDSASTFQPAATAADSVERQPPHHPAAAREHPGTTTSSIHMGNASGDYTYVHI